MGGPSSGRCGPGLWPPALVKEEQGGEGRGVRREAGRAFPPLLCQAAPIRGGRELHGRLPWFVLGPDGPLQAAGPGGGWGVAARAAPHVRGAAWPGRPPGPVKRGSCMGRLPSCPDLVAPPAVRPRMGWGKEGWPKKANRGCSSCSYSAGQGQPERERGRCYGRGKREKVMLREREEREAERERGRRCGRVKRGKKEREKEEREKEEKERGREREKERRRERWGEKEKKKREKIEKEREERRERRKEREKREKEKREFESEEREWKREIY